MRISFRPCLIVLLCLLSPLAVVAGDKNKDKSSSSAANAGAPPSYEMPQPANEELDYAMYDRIRDEGLHHSHVMEFASALTDGIGPRLTGSPNFIARMSGRAINSLRWAA